MKVKVNPYAEEIIYLEPETPEEQRVLKDMWDHGVVAASGSGKHALGICSKKYFGSGSRGSKPSRINTINTKE